MRFLLRIIATATIVSQVRSTEDGQSSEEEEKKDGERWADLKLSSSGNGGTMLRLLVPTVPTVPKTYGPKVWEAAVRRQTHTSFRALDPWIHGFMDHQPWAQPALELSLFFFTHPFLGRTRRARPRPSLGFVCFTQYSVFFLFSCASRDKKIPGIRPFTGASAQASRRTGPFWQRAGSPSPLPVWDGCW